jgi:hypothetical protein
MFKKCCKVIDALVMPKVGETEAKNRRWSKCNSVWELGRETESFEGRLQEGLL